METETQLKWYRVGFTRNGAYRYETVKALDESDARAIVEDMYSGWRVTETGVDDD